MKVKVHSGYLHKAFCDLPGLVNLSVDFIRPFADRFDAIAVRGISGLLVGVPLALRLDKQLIVVRKPKDDTHSPYMVEGYAAGERYLIVDDFVSTGATVKEIQKALKTDENFKHYELAGLYEWNHAEFSTRDRLEKYHPQYLYAEPAQ